MGVLTVTGVIFTALLGGALGWFLRILYRKQYKATRYPVLNYYANTRELVPTWQKFKGDKPTLKVAGTKAKPLIEEKFKITYEGRPGYVIDTKTGEPFRIYPDHEMEYCWPNAYHRLRAHVDIRETKAANASNPDARDWAKVGAILGGLSVLLVFIVLVIVWQSAGRFLGA